MRETVRVLIIDDDEEDFMIIKSLFREIPDRRYHVEWVSSFRQGVEGISRKEHDIYLVDYRLGTDEESGIQVIRESIRSGCQAPMIILTGQNDLEIDEESMRSGALDFLVKGQFSSHELERAIRYSMNHSNNLREIQALNAGLERRVEERTKGLNTALAELETSKRELEKAFNKERELNELKSRFVTMASHEFRTPLSSILSSIDLIARYDTDDLLDKRVKHIDRIRIAVRHLTALLEDFLCLGRLESGTLKANPVPFDLRSFYAQVIDEMQLLTRKGQVIRYRYCGSVKDVQLDARIMKSILINLLSNAIKFSEEDKEITVVVTSNENDLRLEVKDQGMGIPEKDQKHLFRSFFRAENAINVQGTGLGLNIVAKYVEMLEGTISFTSQVGDGTTFSIRFPSSVPSQVAG